MSIEIKGLENMMVKLDKAVSDEAIQAALGKACALVERSAKEKAPKDTGALKRSITSKVEGNTGIIYTTLDYAAYIEYGTGLFAEEGGRQTPWSYKTAKGDWYTSIGAKPQPFMRPALEDNRAAIIKYLKEAIGK